jgi:outer membrane lipoprotein carrier protein
MPGIITKSAVCYNLSVMKKIAFSLAILAALAAGLAAQLNPRDVIARLEKNLLALESFQADFEQSSYQSAVSTPLREKSRVAFQKPERMRWDYTDPEPKTFVFKEGLLLSYFPEDKQLWRQRIPSEQHENDILGLLSGKARLTDKYALEPSPFPGAGPNAAQIKLTPKQDEDNEYILLEVDQKSWLIRRAVLFDWAGNKTEFVFSKAKTNVRLAKDAFDIKVPPDCEVIDGEAPRKK